MADAAAQFSKRTAYNNAGDYFVKETRYVYWDSAQSDKSDDATRNQGDYGGTMTTLSSNLIKCKGDEVLRITAEEVMLPYIWKSPPTPGPPANQGWVVHVQFLMPMSQQSYYEQTEAFSPRHPVYYHVSHYPELMMWYRDAQFNLRTEARGDVCVVPGDRGVTGDTWEAQYPNYHIVDCAVDLYGHTDSYQSIINHINKQLALQAPLENYVTVSDKTNEVGVPYPYKESFSSSVFDFQNAEYWKGVNKRIAYFGAKLPNSTIDVDGAYRFACVSRQYKHDPAGTQYPLNLTGPMTVPFRMVCYSEATATAQGRTGSGESVYSLLHMASVDKYNVSAEADYDASSGINPTINPDTGRAQVAPTFKGPILEEGLNDDWLYTYKFGPDVDGKPDWRKPDAAFLNPVNKKFKLQLLVLDTTFGGTYSVAQPPNALRDDYVLLELDGCARNIAAFPSNPGEIDITDKYPYEEEPIVAKIALPLEQAGKTVHWTNYNKAFGARYASNNLNQIAFRLLDADWFKSKENNRSPAVQFVSPLSWSCVLRVETLARKHTGLAMLAESLFLQHIQVMQGDIIMRKSAAPSMPSAGADAGAGKPPAPDAPKTPEEQFREVMAEFNQKFPSSLYPGGPGWSVNRLESALRAPNEKPALHAESKNASS